VFIVTVENQQCKSELQSGQKIYHNRFGRGIIVGFSSASDAPMVYFYNAEAQKFYNNRVICVACETISLAE